MEPDINDGGVWLTCAQLAERRNVSRAAITKRVNGLEAEGKITTQRKGRSRYVELAEFDRAVGEIGEIAKEAAAETRREVVSSSPQYRDAQAQKLQYEARLRALDLAERQKKLLPIEGDHGIDAAATQCGITLAREIDGIVRYADKIASAVNKDGTTGARRVLKEIAAELRNQSATSLSKIAVIGLEAEKSGSVETELSG